MNHLLFILADTADPTKVNYGGLPQAGANDTSLQTIITIILGVLGALAVLFVVIGGLRYIISGGDPQAVSKAKNTIIYALVGLAVAIAAEAIVAFVLGGL